MRDQSELIACDRNVERSRDLWGEREMLSNVPWQLALNRGSILTPLTSSPASAGSACTHAVPAHAAQLTHAPPQRGEPNGYSGTGRLDAGDGLSLPICEQESDSKLRKLCSALEPSSRYHPGICTTSAQRSTHAGPY